MKKSRKFVLVIQMAAVVILTAIDQLIKYVVLQELVPVKSVTVLDGFLAWT